MCIGATLGSFGGVMANTHSQAIWQSIVPITMQGRVFSARRFIAQALSGIPMFLSGPLVDNVLVLISTKRPCYLTYWAKVLQVHQLLNDFGLNPFHCGCAPGVRQLQRPTC